MNMQAMIDFGLTMNVHFYPGQHGCLQGIVHCSTFIFSLQVTPSKLQLYSVPSCAHTVCAALCAIFPCNKNMFK